MPHFSIEYSANLEQMVDMAALCDHLRRAAVATGVFPMPGVRVRAFRADHVSIADGDAKHAFLDLSIRLRGGRSAEEKARATREMFAALEGFMAPALAKHSIALSIEMRDIDPALSPKTGTIRDHLPATGMAEKES
ncbi:5-carboxymethyl-2-hydroxymuconate isomerase [Aquicoccus sp. G2-2]|uniref:5-carboxymethyl-2-hydroxymuconate isomerase n=1 Tax=Aquicoccus sp. G2-2 TaxID=3092120 RepID=UPI002ADF953F|nr:5-carboxymethyl-2-hydroxymuconate isomerase [Aquicoccus sp. G2-2]MEA1113712.1 5-carboxymethyl-2-hydroxymuconate isomerase [Aquicoccus sp. G2-2]